MRQTSVWLLIILLLVVVANWRKGADASERDLSYSRFYSEQLGQRNVQRVEVGRQVLVALLKSPTVVGGESTQRIRVSLGDIQIDHTMVAEWTTEYDVGEVAFRQSSGLWQTFAINWLPLLILIFLALFFVRQMQGGQKGILSFGKSTARQVPEDKSKITFEEVAGAEEAKQELQEIVEFLQDPGKYQRLGGKIPKGVLMVGPPGTGKTYMAKAVAGEADVPFFSMSGSDFVEMFVGVGASRVRDLFGTGKSHAPCILFVDEIDAVGRYRGAGLGGGHDEREQTLNQLLVEMDGFESNDGVILIAATNRPDVLDPALLRPGRFDRLVVVDLPDVKGRQGILRIHTREVSLADSVDLEDLAKGTPGLSGADLRNLVNEGCLLAARRNRQSVSQAEFEDAKDKVMLGTERRSVVMSPEDKRVTAYHEVGHALTAIHTPGADPIHKITIVPRGQALGATFFLPDDERRLTTRTRCLEILVKTLGGRAAEQVVFNEITNGAQNDIEVATSLARRMVCEWGMSDLVGPVTVGKSGGEVFLGREIVQSNEHSEETAHLIDDEIRGLIEEAVDNAVKIIREHRQTLDRLAEALLEREVLDKGQIDRLIAGAKLDEKPSRSARGRGRDRSRSGSAESSERPARRRGRGQGGGSERTDKKPTPPPAVSDATEDKTETTDQPRQGPDESVSTKRRRRRRSRSTQSKSSAETTTEQPTPTTAEAADQPAALIASEPLAAASSVPETPVERPTQSEPAAAPQEIAPTEPQKPAFGRRPATSRADLPDAATHAPESSGDEDDAVVKTPTSFGRRGRTETAVPEQPSADVVQDNEPTEEAANTPAPTSFGRRAKVQNVPSAPSAESDSEPVVPPSAPTAESDQAETVEPSPSAPRSQDAVESDTGQPETSPIEQPDQADSGEVEEGQDQSSANG